MHWFALVVAVMAPALICACAAAAPQLRPTAEQSAPVARAGPQYGAFGFDTSGMGAGVKPGDDFFAYANGGWVKSAEIPVDRSSYNTFSVLREVASRRTADLIIELSKSDAPAGSEARKIGDYYDAFMDVAAIEARGAAPLKPDLDRIAGIRTRSDLARELGTSLRADVDALNATDLSTERPLGLWVAEALEDTSRYRAYLMQGGLSLPDREYYLSETPRYVALRDAFRAHVTAMFELAGLDRASARAENVLALESAIAAVHWSGVDSTDIAKNKTVWAQAEFPKQAPGLDWDAYFAAAGLQAQPELGVWQSTAIAGLARLAGNQPLEAWRDYLAFHAIERGAPFLSKAFVEEHFAFNSRILSGTPEPPARWKRAVDRTNQAMGEATGRRYVERHFTPEAKAQVQSMVDDILAAFGQRIDRLAWMTPATKAKAREKLATFRVGIGYPATWRDYSGLEVARDDAYGNHARAELFEFRRNLSKLGGPVDRSEWFMLPQDVNALNAPLQNAIIFPAAILAPPFFDPKADPAVNYGAIGGIIGHEIVHSFDDTGAMFDARGALANWWTPEDLEHFKRAGAALSAQYSAYRPLPDLAVNGDLTLGENIADLAGLAVAYDAYHLSLRGRPAPVIDGYSGDQRLFLGWAQNYRSKSREAAVRRGLLTNVHSPGEYRADTVRNIDAWYEAFDVKPGERLYLAPADRVRVW